MLGGVFWANAMVVAPKFRVADLVPTLLAFLFVAGYIVYLLNNKRYFLITAVLFYFMYTLLIVWQTYLYPLVSPQEYIAAIAIYSALGVPMVALLCRSRKDNK